MIKKEFKRIATTENGTFSFRDKDIPIGGGVRSPHVVYLLSLNYKGYTINIKNETGLAFYGVILCTIKANGKPLEFELTTRSHFSTLFRSTKNRFRVKADYLNVKTFLQRSKALKDLETMARKDIFEPSITGVYNGADFELTCKYHLQFSDWTQVLEPFIAFYKEWIDEFAEIRH